MCSGHYLVTIHIPHKTTFFFLTNPMGAKFAYKG